MTASIALDAYMAERFSMIAPHYDIHSTENPMTIKNNIQMPAVMVTNIAHWLRSERMVI